MSTVIQPVTSGLRAYTKLLVAVGFALASTVSTLIDSGGTPLQWLQVLSQAVVLAGTYVASQQVPGARYAKAVTTATGAALSVLIGVIGTGGDLTAGVILNMVFAVVGVLGVYQFADKDKDGVNVLAKTSTDSPAHGTGYPGM